LRVLVLCDDGPGHATTLYDYLDALQHRSRHSLVRFNPRRHDSRLLSFDAFDAVVVHWSLVLMTDGYIPPRIRAGLRAYDGPKIQFIQDEYRWVDEMTASMRDVGISAVFSLVSPPAREAIYAERLPGVELHTTLTGFVPEDLVRRSVLPIRDRTVDVAYRGRVVPYWLGSLAQEKAAVAKRMIAVAREAGLRYDIAWDEASRIYGDAWIDFIASARATLGTESGASIVDFDRECERAVDEYLRQHPDADFDEVAREVLTPWEGNIVMNVVSPRVFEAAALRTALVMHRGEYSGVVTAEQHYIPLAKDFSNSDEVIERLRDSEYLQELADRTYEEIALSPRWQFDTMVSDFDDVVERQAGRPRAGGLARYRGARVERRMRDSLATLTIGSAPLTTREPDQTLIGRRFATTALRAAFVARGSLTSPAQRRLARTTAQASLAGRIHARTALEDLLAISLVADAAAGRLAGYRFEVDIQPEQAPEELVTHAPATAPRAESAPRLGAGAVLWRNVGAPVFAPIAPGVSVRITVGDPEVPWHDLSRLLDAVPRETVQDVLDEAFEREQGEPITIRSLEDARANAVKAFGAMRMIVIHTPLRRLTATWRRVSSEARPAFDLLLDDVFKLVALREARRGGLAIDVEAVDGRILLRSSATAHEDAFALPAGPWEDIRWDHSRVGSTVALSSRNGQTAVIGEHGRYRFAALSRLSPLAADEVAGALRWALEG
jgi:hypothetical protein